MINEGDKSVKRQNIILLCSLTKSSFKQHQTRQIKGNVLKFLILKKTNC